MWCGMGGWGWGWAIDREGQPCMYARTTTLVCSSHEMYDVNFFFICIMICYKSLSTSYYNCDQIIIEFVNYCNYTLLCEVYTLLGDLGTVFIIIYSNYYSLSVFVTNCYYFVHSSEINILSYPILLKAPQSGGTAEIKT